MIDHINDNELQGYALDIQTTSDPEISNHVRGCEICRQKLVQYQLLFKSLGQMELPATDGRLIEAVMNRIPETTRGSRLMQNNSYYWVGMGLLLLVVGCFLILPGSFIDWIKGMNVFAILLLMVTSCSLIVFLLATQLFRYRRIMSMLNTWIIATLIMLTGLTNV